MLRFVFVVQATFVCMDSLYAHQNRVLASLILMAIVFFSPIVHCCAFYLHVCAWTTPSSQVRNGFRVLYMFAPFRHTLGTVTPLLARCGGFALPTDPTPHSPRRMSPWWGTPWAGWWRWASSHTQECGTWLASAPSSPSPRPTGLWPSSTMPWQSTTRACTAPV